MEQIIYSKFSNERNRDLAIRTDILQDDSSKRVVRKTPLYEEGVSHVLESLEWERKLTEKYQGTCISMNHGEKDGNSIRFEYLEGKTLETILDDLYLEGKYEELLDVFRQYIEIIKKANGTKEFRRTEKFDAIFGPLGMGKALYAADISNIDMVVGNIIVNGDTWNVIDYEWTFDFPIPVNFIIFRTIFYYVYATAKRDALKEIGFYKIFGITEKEQECYLKMENDFQRFIISGIVPIRDMYKSISKGSISASEIQNICKNETEDRKIQVYFDYGNGFSEQDSIWCNPYSMDGDVAKYVIAIDKEITGMRIDPSNHSCLLSIKRVTGKADFDYEPKIVTNAIDFGKDTYLFADEDPQLYLSDLRANTKYIFFDVVKENVIEELAERVKLDYDTKTIKYSQEIAHMQQEVTDKQNLANSLSHRALVDLPQKELMVADLNHRLYLAELSFHEIQGSFCWKITKPIRILSSSVKRLFRNQHALKWGMKSTFRFIFKGPKRMHELNRADKEAKRSFHIYDEISVTCDMDELQKQRDTIFSDERKFSVVVPLYNTPELYLRKMIESVLYQTYENLELCLADGSDKEHKYVKEICKEYNFYDKRIKYKKLKKNLGISDNTNACLEMSEGDYIVLFDHDDFLHPSALYENMKAIEEQDADFIYTDENTFRNTIDDAYSPHFKPDFSPDYLRSINYICHLTTFSRTLYQKVGGFRKEFDGSQDYDMILRLTEQAEHIVHIPKVLYFWRAHEQSVAMDIHAKDYCIVSAKKALEEHLRRVGLKGTVEDAALLSAYRIRYELKEQDLVSILIPNKDHVSELDRCIDSIINRSTYTNYEIIIIENNSEEPETFDYYKKIQDNPKIQVVEWEKEFNYSAINNFGASFAKGKYLLLLNNDVEIISPDWLEEMLMFLQRDDVGAVGAKLYYPNDTIQHAGVILGIGGVGGHSHKYFPREDYGYFARLVTAQDLSAVTAACLMVKKSLFDQLKGLDEDYKVAFNDVDFCMRIRQAGYLIVYTPYAELYHYESLSRGAEDTPEKVERFNGEVRRFQQRWGEELKKGDPYYNPNLSLEYEDFRKNDGGKSFE